nr:MAG TPA: hypothetical protein [Caudoviricetes sp.]
MTRTSGHGIIEIVKRLQANPLANIAHSVDPLPGGIFIWV